MAYHVYVFMDNKNRPYYVGKTNNMVRRENEHKKAITENEPAVIGDVLFTCANTSLLQKDFGVFPSISINEGLNRFISWYNEYYGVNLGK